MLNWPLYMPTERGVRRRHALLVGFKIVISAGLLAILLRRADLSGIAEGLRRAAPIWIAAALGLYLLMLAISAWRWQRLLAAQAVALPVKRLFESFLVATFFNNFLPSNVGGDVVRIADTARPAGSKTLATTVILLDRGVGLLGLVLVAAVGASLARGSATAAGPVGATTLWASLVAGTALSLPFIFAPQLIHVLMGPVRRLHPEWIDERLERLTAALIRFRESPSAMVACFAGAVVVQVTLVIFYWALARSLAIPIGLPQLALLVPVSFLVQMVPISINGFGVREATFGLYFRQLGLPLHSALLLSLGGAAAVMLISLAGAAAYVARIRRLHTRTHA
jgi:uncharacterized protein (TIRG00374 family)